MSTPLPTSFVVIPARLHSTRLPRKLLLRDTGRTVLQHTYEAALEAVHPSGVLVAADHPEIVREVNSFGGEAIMTDPQAATGTDRVAEAAQGLACAEIIVNVQGDEPEIRGADIDLLVELLASNPQTDIATLATPIRSLNQLHDPNCVKAVFNRDGQALYFSRSPVPYVRDGWETINFADRGAGPSFYQHIGMYAYRRDFLLRIREIPRSPIEEREKLEQLRFLAAGYAIQVGVIESASIGIDTADDYRAFVLRRAG